MKISSLVVACSLVALAGCTSSTVKDTLGLSRQAPDEFRVVSRPPLSVPPQFNLRPPSNSDESPSYVPADKQAQSVVTGSTSAPTQPNDGGNVFSLKNAGSDTAVVPVTSAPLGAAAATDGDSAEAQLLKNAGADKADPKVRDTLIEQHIAKEEAKEDCSWWNISCSATPDKKEPVVNAKGEQQRITTNKAEGKPVTDGDTPEAKDKDRGLLGRIFNW